MFKDLDFEMLSKVTEGKSWRFLKQLINNTVLSFAHTRLKNPRSKLITTQDIIKNIELIEEKVKSNKIWFLDN